MERSEISALPKVLLHDHLDGGLRPDTVLDLAEEIGHALPADSAEGLANWFDQGSSKSLEQYLEAFSHTIAVMQTPEALDRVAFEAVEDLAGDGVVYAEIRFAPSLHTVRGLTRREVLTAVLGGIRRGSGATGTPVGVIVDAMRQDRDSEEVAVAASEFAGDGVVGFDLAGPEKGFPPRAHRRALDMAKGAGLHLTIHAGEDDGPASVADALACGAERIGHGIRLLDECRVVDGEITEVGPVGLHVLMRNATLEVCPTSGLHTGSVAHPADHPIGMLYRAGFPVSVNTDNRLMSRTSMTDEMLLLVEHQRFSLEDLRAVTLAAIDGAFCDSATRTSVREQVVGGYAS